MATRVELLKAELLKALSNGDANNLFAVWDQDGSGSLSPTEFYQALLLLGLDVNGDEAGHLFNSLDIDGNRQIDYRELRTALQPPEPPPPLEVLTEQIAALLSANLVRVSDLFKSWDASGDGMIDAAEFHRGLTAVLGVGCTRAETDALFASWDGDGSGSIDYREMHRLLRQGSSMLLEEALQDGAAGEIELESKNSIALREGPQQSHSRVLGASDGRGELSLDGDLSIAEQLSLALQSNWGRVSDLFHEWDTTGDGAVDVAEFARAVELLGLHARQDLRASEQVRERHAQLVHAQKVRQKQAARRSPRDRKGAGGVTLPPLTLSAKLLKYENEGRQRRSNDEQLAEYQKRGLQLRRMMDKLMSEENSQGGAEEAVTAYVELPDATGDTHARTR